MNAGTINGYGNSGGIVGYVNAGVINSSYNVGKVTVKEQTVGGIVGFLVTAATITNCYNVGVTTGPLSVGGIAGANGNGVGTAYGGSIKNSYFLNSVSKGVGFSYNNGKNEIYSKTNSQMQQLEVMLGEDFVKDSQNKNNGYPILKWQN